MVLSDATQMCIDCVGNNKFCTPLTFVAMFNTLSIIFSNWLTNLNLFPEVWTLYSSDWPPIVVNNGLEIWGSLHLSSKIRN